MRPRWIWLTAAVAYGLFLAWYVSWSPPLRADEIDGYLARMEARAEAAASPERRAAVRAFLEADDGGEFFMVNLIRLHPGEVAIPGEAGTAPADAVLERYTGFFMPKLLRRAGHPSFYGRGAGGYVDAWNVWWSDYGNTPEAFAALKDRVDKAAVAVGRDPATLEATAAVLVQLEGGGGRVMGDYGAGAMIEPITGSPAEIAEQLAAFGDAGASHIQLVVDPITRQSIEWLPAVLDLLPGR